MFARLLLWNLPLNFFFVKEALGSIPRSGLSTVGDKRPSSVIDFGDEDRGPRSNAPAAPTALSPSRPKLPRASREDDASVPPSGRLPKIGNGKSGCIFLMEVVSPCRPPKNVSPVAIPNPRASCRCAAMEPTEEGRPRPRSGEAETALRLLIRASRRGSDLYANIHFIVSPETRTVCLQTVLRNGYCAKIQVGVASLPLKFQYTVVYDYFWKMKTFLTQRQLSNN